MNNDPDRVGCRAMLHGCGESLEVVTVDLRPADQRQRRKNPANLLAFGY